MTEALRPDPRQTGQIWDFSGIVNDLTLVWKVRNGFLVYHEGIWGVPKMWVPLVIILFYIGIFHEIDHPAIGLPP